MLNKYEVLMMLATAFALVFGFTALHLKSEALAYFALASSLVVLLAPILEYRNRN